MVERTARARGPALRPGSRAEETGRRAGIARGPRGRVVDGGRVVSGAGAQDV